MFVCSMLNEGSKTELKNERFDLQFPDSPVQGSIILTEDKKIVGPVSGNEVKGIDIFMNGLTNENKSEVYRVGKPNGRKGNITFEMIEDTEENPLIAVICNNITFYEKVEADIRFVVLDNNTILAMLVSGVCGFNGVSMQRCNTQNFDTADEYVYDAMSLKALAMDTYYDRKIGYRYGNDVVGAMTITRSDGSAISIQRAHVKDFFIDDTKYKRYVNNHNEFVRKAEQRKAEEIALRDSKSAEAKRMAELRAEAEKKKAAEELEKKLKKGPKKEKVKEVEIKNGAAAFLAAVRSLQ